jgi:hypothetical protein
MGREIRRVPADWEHPKHERCPHWPACSTPCFRTLYDKDYHSAARMWIADFEAWRRGERPEVDGYWWEWDGPPDPEHCRDRAWTDEEATHFQVYETVSEGTPVTPAFATREELVDYLATHGDLWDQQRGDGPWSRQAAERFVMVGWAPTLLVNRSATGTTIIEPRGSR